MARNPKQNQSDAGETDSGRTVWLAICYLDPDKEREPSGGGFIATWIALCVLFCALLIWLHLRGR